MTGYITIIGHQKTQVALKRCVPFNKCIIQNDETAIDDVEDLHLVIPMSYLIESRSNYSKTTRSL